MSQLDQMEKQLIHYIFPNKNRIYSITINDIIYLMIGIYNSLKSTVD